MKIRSNQEILHKYKMYIEMLENSAELYDFLKNHNKCKMFNSDMITKEFEKINHRIFMRAQRIYEALSIIEKELTMTIIKTNKIKCLKCGDIIESKHRHDYKHCKCGSVCVDGGKDYLRRGWTEGEPKDYYEELSDYYEDPDDDKYLE